MSDTETMICPRCLVGLHQAAVSDVRVWGCGRCGGIWLDNDGSRRVLERVNPQIVALAQQAGSVARGQTDEQREAQCPACRTGMQRVPGGDPSVQVDICEQHGTWFDRNELQQVSMLAERRRRRGQVAVGAATGVAAGAALAGAVALVAQTDESSQYTETLVQGAGNLATATAEVLGNVGSGIIEVGGQIVASGAIELVIEGTFSLLGAILSD